MITGDQVLAFRDFNERVSLVTRQLARQCLTARLGDITVSGARLDHVMDL